MKTKFFFFIFLTTLFGCSFSTSGRSGYYDPYFKNYVSDVKTKNFLYCAIPDKYNTGCDENTRFKKLNPSSDPKVKDIYVDGIYLRIGYDSKGKKRYVLTGYSSFNPNINNELRDYDFSDGEFVIQDSQRFPHDFVIFFKNCKFSSFRNNGPFVNNHVFSILDHCTFTGSIGTMNMKFIWCKFTKHPSDAMNPLYNFTVQYSYICDLMCKAVGEDVHVDGIQIFGDTEVKGGGIFIDNVRFEIPSIYYPDNGKGGGVNACVMFQLEFGDVSNVTFSNLICSGGGRWFPIYLKHTSSKKNGKYYKIGDRFDQYNITMKNVQVSNIYNKIFYPVDYADDAYVDNVTSLSNLFVSSIFEENGKIHIIYTNDTKDNKTFRVVTNKASNNDKVIQVPFYPNDFMLLGDDRTDIKSDSKGRLFTDYKYDDLPIDKDLTIDASGVSFIRCYDGDVLIAECYR